MLGYVKAMADRIQHLRVEYEMTAEAASRARIEARSAEQAHALRESERVNLIHAFDYWTNHPDTAFEDADLMRQMVASLRTMRTGGAS